MKVYLAGGFRGDWQERVVTYCHNLEFFNPKEKEKERNLTLSEYGTWDLHYIKKCDIVFAYFERTNPSGVGLSCEIGYAKALGKTVILCLETGNERDRYNAFTKLMADIVFDDIDGAIEYLSLFK